MLNILWFTINSIFPLIGIILLGYILRQVGFFNENFISIANKFVFKLCLPALLFYNIYNIESISEINWSSLAFAISMTVVLFLIGLVAAILTTDDNKRRGVIWQCVYRSNFALIGFPLAMSLFGDEGGTVAALLSGFTIPIYNIFAVISLSVFVSGNKVSVKKVLNDIIHNPLIIGAGLGLLVLALRWLIGETWFSLKGSLSFLYDIIGQVAAFASPLALIVLGGQFRLRAARSMAKEITVATIARIVVAPVLAISLAVLLEHMGVISLSGADYAAYIALFGTPVAVSSAIMAGNMGSDEQLASQLVVWTSLFSIATLFALVFFTKMIGLI